MKEWYAASELVGFNGIPTTRTRILEKAKRDGWKCRPRTGKGGGNEFHISSFPEETRVDIALKERKSTTNSIEVEAKKVKEFNVKGANLINGLTVKERSRLDARLSLLATFETFKAEGNLSLRRAAPIFADLYKKNEVFIESWIREEISTISSPTILRWLKQRNEKDIKKLAGSRFGQHRVGTGVIDKNPELKEFIVAQIQQRPHINAMHVMRLIRSKFSKCTLPGYRTVQRFIVNYLDENAVIHTALTNPDKHKSKFQVAFGSASDGIIDVNQLWELDSTPADVMCTDGKRYNLVGAIDVYTRRVTVLVTETADAEGVCALMRKAMMKWGVPETIKTDNGSDYVSKRFTTAMTALGIDRKVCTAYSPEQKPHIERFFKTQTVQLFELLAGYVGHDVNDRKQIEDRLSFAKRLEAKQRGELDEVVFDAKMTPQELQEHIDNWCENIYHRQPHSGLSGKTPFAVHNAWKGTVSHLNNERALDVLLSDSGKRIVGKNGIKIDGAYFIAPELAEYVNNEVRLFKDPMDMGRLYVYEIGNDEDPFICIAECPERTGIDRREVAKKAKSIQKQMISKGRKEANKRSKSVKPQDAIHDYLVEQGEIAGQVVSLPKGKDKHMTDMMESLEKAMQKPKGNEQSSLDEKTQKMFEKLDVQSKAPIEKQKKILKIESKEIRFKRWLDVDSIKARGVKLSNEDLEFWTNYQNTPEFKGEKRMRESFGEQVGETAAAN